MEKFNLITNSAIDLGDNLEAESNGKGRKFISRFIEAGVAHYEQFGDILIKKETLDKFIHTMIGCPVIIKHKDITDKNVDKERVGVVSDVWYNQSDGWFYCSGIIWDKQAIDLVKNQGWNVSCTYDFESDKQPLTHNGKELAMEFTNGNFLHLALVDNPRYNDANIVMNSKEEVNNGWVTLADKSDESGRPIRVFIAGYGGGSYKAPNWYKEQVDEYKNNKTTKFVLTDVSEEKQKEIKDTVSNILKEYDIPDLIGVSVGGLSSNYAFNLGNGERNAIRLSRKYYTNPELMKKEFSNNCKTGFHPKGLVDVSPEKAVLMHELGHSITAERKNTEFWNDVKDIQKRYEKELKKDPNSKNFISRYADRNYDEFIAEAFCDAKLSEKPSDYSIEVLNLIDKHYKLNSSEAKQLRLFNSIMKAINELKKDKEKDEYEITWWEEGGFGYPVDEEELKEWDKKQKEEGEEAAEEQAKNSFEDNLDSILDDYKPIKEDLPILNGLKDILE